MKRIHEIDALRGIALFGILLVNIFVFHAPYYYYSEFYGAFQGIQATTVDLVVNFAGGKFLFIFAFLFGYGLRLQHGALKKDFSKDYLRKMAVLLFIGLIHILFFWFGDILLSYALLGMLMIALIRLPKKTILPLGILLLMFSPFYYLGNVLWAWPTTGTLESIEMSEFIAVFQNGSYFDVFELRMIEFISFIPENFIWFIPKTLGLFLIGYHCATKNFTNHIRNRTLLYSIVSIFFFLIYLGWTFIKPDFFGSFDLIESPHLRPVLIAINIVFESVLGITYIVGFLLIFQNFKKLSYVFGKTGRMALTNYILQSSICVIIFYGFGLGYYGKLKPTDLVLISIFIFIVNVLFSFCYLHYFKQGPLEYLWRRMSKKRS